MKKIISILFIIIPIGIVFCLNHKWGDVPPLGKFLDPYGGFWENTEDVTVAAFDLTKTKGIHHQIDVVFDKNKVPHIFAQDNHDAYFAQGYITAQDRLWQMDFQTRFAAGRISEVVGEKAIALDQYQRRMGMVFGAENSLKGMLSDSSTKEMILAYTDGINAYIKSLGQRDYPLEFKLLDYKPELWTPLKCALLLKQMAATLSMGTDDGLMTNILQTYGSETTENLFPNRTKGEDPIIPPGTPLDFKPLPTPKEPLDYLQHLTSNQLKPLSDVESGVGSNNWALSGSKTASGYPLLENDPHLNLTLPSIWYQIQLHTPLMNVCGVSLPGSPGVIIGFNQNIAWGVTNVDADVTDFYKIQFNDKKTHYLFDGKWLPLRKKIEQIQILGQKTITDTVYYTHHGPVAYMQPSNFGMASSLPVGHAFRWIAHDISNELKCIYLLNTGKNYDDYRNAIQYFASPAQNFIFASSTNDIAITPNGKFPLKWEAQGKYTLDGSTSEDDWHGWIPANQNPTVKNPPRGFVSSANQASTDEKYPYYINWEFAPWERGKRINELLAQMQQANVDSLRLMQTDNYSIFAAQVLPAMLQHVQQNAIQGNALQAFQMLQKWNFKFEANAIAAAIFDHWFNQIDTAIWDDNFGKSQKKFMRYPNINRTKLLLMNEPNSPWFDDVRTSNREDYNTIATKSFLKTITAMENKYGANVGKPWEWGNVKATTIMHLAKIPGLNSEVLYTGGAKNTINAMSAFNGPSWRMIVDLKPPISAFGIYPGGQSGNPGSIYYDNMIQKWAKGELNTLVFMKNLADTSKHTLAHLVIKKK